MTGLVLFHDYTSPGSAVAVLRVQRLADEGLPVTFQGFEAIGLDATLPLTLDVAAAVDDLAETAVAEGITLCRPPDLPPTALAHVVGTVAEQAGRGGSWRETCYRAFWSEGAAIGDRDVLLGLAERAGLDTEAVRPALEDRLLLITLRRRMANDRRNGVGGVPTILTNRTLVPGLLSLDDLRALAAL
jgi:predicted DsbA family dithiol-disulfide isomerase